MKTAQELTAADYRRYIDAFNRSDFAQFSRFYRADLEFHGRGGDFRGRDAVVAFYREVHSRLREKLEVRRIIEGPGQLVADVVTQLQAGQDWPDFPTGPLKKGQILHSQNFIWYEHAGGEFTRIRSAHYRRGDIPDDGPGPAPVTADQPALTAERFGHYIDAFNRNDYGGFADYYSPDVVLVIAGRQELRGRDSIVDFYRDVKARTRRTIRVNRLITAPGAIAAELESEFLALEDLADFTAGPMLKGDRIFINTIALYDLEDGRFRRIRSAVLRKIYRPVDST
ncbi:MAG TPA: nuclear transport factor 2 family protein [Steroidobacteraceae bacterium]|nr:nuclear transport factor 2 family protein [Steroidobacteraceae bacterium]